MRMEERLQRVIASRGAASRRVAERLIREGRVSVNGTVIRELGTKIDPDTHDLRVDGKRLPVPRRRYLLLNKPRGYITTTSDERGRRTVLELVPTSDRIFPVGRLDRETEGLLLLTNDGDVAHRVMHPRYRLAKEYHVVTASVPNETVLNRLRSGVLIDGRRIVPDECRLLRQSREGVQIKIVIHEGMYRVVRRMMEEVGVSVERLRRTRIGPLMVSGIPVGGWRELTAGEVSTLFEAIHLDRSQTRAGTPRKRKPALVGR